MHKKLRAIAETADKVGRHLRHLASVEHHRSTAALVTSIEYNARLLERAAQQLRALSSQQESGGWLPDFFQR